MTKHKKGCSDAFESIKKGLEQAIAHRHGDLVEGVRIHYVERMPDNTMRRIEEGGDP